MTTENKILISDVCPKTGKKERITLLEYRIEGLRGRKLLPGSCENEACPLNGTAYCQMYLKKIGKLK